MYDALMERYAFKSPSEIDEIWSRALMWVMSEAIFHANYTPPTENNANGHPNQPPPGAQVVPMDLSSIFQMSETK